MQYIKQNGNDTGASEGEKYLAEIIAKIEPTKNQKATIHERIDRMRDNLEGLDYLKREQGLSRKTYLHGSFKRNTLIRKQGEQTWDVDLIAVVGGAVPRWDPSSSHEDLPLPQSHLNTLKNKLNQLYTINDLGQDYPCITVEYKSDNLNIEIMPVWVMDNRSYFDSLQEFQRSNSGEGAQDKWRVFLIPDPTHYNNWIRTRPFLFETELTQINQDNSGFVVPIIKLLKYWNQIHRKLFRSFEIEKYTCYFFSQNSVSLKNKGTEEISLEWFRFMENIVRNNIIIPNIANDNFKPQFLEDDALKSNIQELLVDSIDEFKTGNIASILPIPR